jgi:hypothetical protein
MSPPARKRSNASVVSDRFSLSAPAELPADAYWHAVDAIVSANRSLHDAAVAANQSAATIGRQYKKRLDAVIGSRHGRKYRALRQQARRALRAARKKLPRTAAGRRRLSNLRREHVRQSLEFLAQHDIDVARIRRVQKEFAQQLRAAWAAPAARRSRTGGRR